MKKKLLTLSLLVTTAVAAQPTIQMNDFKPTVGETMIVTYGPYISPGSAGNNQTWDLSAAIDQTPVTINSLSPGTGVATANTKLEYVGASVIYSLMDNTGYYVLREEAGGTVINYSNSKQMYKFPLAMNGTFTDTFNGSATVSGYNLTRSGSTNGVIDGYGTLITPSGTYSNVLRIKTTQTTTDNMAGATNTASTETYTWVKAGIHLEIAVSQEINLPTGAQSHTYYLKSSSLGLIEHGDEQTFIYPNPTNGITTIFSINGFEELTVYNVNGEKVGVEYNPINGELNASNLQAGIYLVETLSSNKRSIQRLIKQ